MKICHVGALASVHRVNGLNSVVWIVAKEQALMGHQVTVLLNAVPTKETSALADRSGLELIHIPLIMKRWRYEPKLLKSLLCSNPPHIVHMHNMFQPDQATLAKSLVQNSIPYIITPHGMTPQLLRRSWLKKSLYSWLLEKPRFYAAAAITAVTPAEEKVVRTFVPHYPGIVRCVSNPIEVHDLEGQSWKGDIGAKRLVYLGRFDILHKGIDIMVDIARLLPDVEFQLYGTKDRQTKGWLESLQSNLPANVHFCDPVFASDKAKVLANASLYIQTSRWEVFGISIAEAMYLGVPCAIADTLNLAEVFQQHDLGLVLPPDSKRAASNLLEVLNYPARLYQWSERARTFAQAHFQPHAVASEYLNLYEEILCG